MIDVKGLYIHYPFCIHLCNYCDFYKFKFENESAREFEKIIYSQIKLLKDDKFNFDTLKTIYLGGGTPSLWGLKLTSFLNTLMTELKISKSKLEEITLEVDPDTWTEESFDSWLSWGINRFSIGVQAFDEDILRVLDRRHTIGDIQKTLKFLNEKNLNYSIDLLIGAPVEHRDLKKELVGLMEYSPKHISAYILKTRANYPLKDKLPNDDKVIDEYLCLSNELKSNEMIHYEVSNFALANFESKHNSSYWDLANILAIGPNATGFYRDGNSAKRYQVSAKTQKFIYEELTPEQLKLEEIYLQMRTNKGIKPLEYFPIKEWQKLRNGLVRWSEENYFSAFSDESLILNSNGFLVLDNLMDEFFKFTSL